MAITATLSQEEARAKMKGAYAAMAGQRVNSSEEEPRARMEAAYAAMAGQRVNSIDQQVQPCSPRPCTLAEEAEEGMLHHAAQHGKHSAVHEFFSKHPEFDEFVRLVRSGSIRF